MNEMQGSTANRTETTHTARHTGPTTGRRRMMSIVLSALLILSLLLSDALDHANAGTGTDSSAIAAIDTVDNDRPADSAVVRNDGERVSGPVSSQTVGLTVGERLKNLDSLMTVVPADRLPQLMMEYERILDSAMMAQSSTPARTSRPKSSSREIAAQSSQSTPTPLSVTTSSFAPLTTASTEPSIPDATETVEESITTTSSQPLGYIRSQPRSSISSPTSTTLIQSDYLNADSTKTRQFDPSEYRGIRKSEIERYERKRGDRPANTTSTAKRKTTVKRTPAKRYRADRATKSKIRSGHEDRRYGSFETPATTFRKRTTSTPTSGKVSAFDRAFTNGLALVRAGRYAEAVTPLKEAVKGSRSYRTTAQYYLALSYANAGNAAAATPLLTSLKSGSGPLSDKAWIAYARMLGASGKRADARTELLRFLRVRPSSPLSAEGRAVLQQI